MPIKETKEKELPLVSGIPPWHAFAFVTLLIAVSVPNLPSWEEIDALSTPELWTTRKFPDLVSLKAMAFARLGIAGVALGLTLYLMLLDPGWDVFPNYKPHSKLRRVFIRLEGLGTMAPFTSWCWLIFGLGFLTRGLLALAGHAVETNVVAPSWATNLLSNQVLLRATMILWELTGPFAVLVSSVVKFVIWPEVVKSGKPHKLSGFRNQLQHNCNSIFALLEVTFLGGMSVEFSHLSMAMTVGYLYMGFTWIMANLYFGNAQVGPQYIYWFMDTTLESTTTKALAALAFALTLFFVVFSLVVGTVLGGSDGEPSKALNASFLLLVSSFVCRFKD